MKLQVLIADKLSESAVSELSQLGAQVRLEPELGADDLPSSIGEAEVLVVRSTKITRATIEAGSNLSLIVRAGAGVNTIDIAAASEYGIAVANCPGKNTAAVAELVIGLLIAADRRIPAATADLQSGRWRKKAYQSAAGLKGRRLGVVGFGSIGRAVARAAMGLGMEVAAWSRSLTPEAAAQADVTFCPSMREAAQCDAVSIHLASTPETKGSVNEDFFGSMKPRSIFINTSRGEIVDQSALTAAIEQKQLRVGLDVYAKEPGSGEAPFEDMEFAKALSAATPHIGASTDQASAAIADETVRVVRSYIETGNPVNVVNIRKKATDAVTLVVRHYNRVGVLASELDLLKDAGINIEEMENTIFQGGATASCSLKLDKTPDAPLLEKLRSPEHVIQVMVK